MRSVLDEVLGYDVIERHGKSGSYMKSADDKHLESSFPSYSLDTVWDREKIFRYMASRLNLRTSNASSSMVVAGRFGAKCLSRHSVGRNVGAGKSAIGAVGLEKSKIDAGSKAPAPY
jgi:hypothetical protein